jgi:hypothetical protein
VQSIRLAATSHWLTDDSVATGGESVSPDEHAAVVERWRQAGEEVAAHDDQQRSRLRDQVGAAERAVLEVVEASAEPPSPTRVLELLARRRNGVTQSAGALAIQRLVARGRLRLTSDASLELVAA